MLRFHSNCEDCGSGGRAVGRVLSRTEQIKLKWAEEVDERGSGPLAGVSMGTIRVYYTSVTGSREVKQRQSDVIRILDGNRMKYQLVDVSISESLLQEMRDKAGKPDAIPPQIFNGEEYCGDFEMLYEATENEEVRKFLKIGRVDNVAREGISI
ncbi:domain-binding glutamic acid-rich 3 [Podarcis lilfordi]|uniref:Domain-binding glutamic acid-rich 3 n=1 Tax=Podarcis lilfordi TaxID=74358 RepID=A0AA35LD72_9SAUR|nr:domain-binding glutamic acid-rich 3 [Podarcis lilfordi]